MPGGYGDGAAVASILYCNIFVVACCNASAVELTPIPNRCIASPAMPLAYI